MTLSEIETKFLNTSLPIHISSPKASVAYLAPKGQLDMNTTHFLTEAAEALINEGYVRIILDLDGVPYAASLGIGAIINILKRITTKGGKLILISIRPKVLDVFNLLGFVHFLTIMDSLDDAIKAI